jgi:predicted HTH transcriptional regulator
MKQKIFVSGVQKELSVERKAVKELVDCDYLLKEHFEVFLFEDSPAQTKPANKVYINEVGASDIYLCIIGEKYGAIDKLGVSATENEYNEAVKKDKKCLIYLKRTEETEKQTEKFIKRVKDAECGRVYDRFNSADDLVQEVYKSLIDILREDGVVSSFDFDERVCKDADMSDIDLQKVRWFLSVSKAAGRFPYDEKTSAEDAFVHMKLFNKGKLTNAAVLLFGKDPQKFNRQAVTKCLKVPGTEIAKPFDNYQIYGGNIFEQADKAASFVYDSLRQPVIQIPGSVAVNRPVEIPVFVISEAIINAIAHRNYNPSAGVQVHVLADRIEIFNPGRLPDELTIEDLSKSHQSFPANPLIADAFFKADYIQQAGSGTKEMVKLCRTTKLPEPVFESHRGIFKTVIYRDIHTEDMLKKAGLNDRQIKAVLYAKQKGSITNKEFQSVCEVSKRTATRDLTELIKLNILKMTGKKGAGAVYTLK